jgi:hypothetical protein
MYPRGEGGLGDSSLGEEMGPMRVGLGNSSWVGEGIRDDLVTGRAIWNGGQAGKNEEWTSKGEGEFNWVWLTRVNSEVRVIGVHNPDCQGALQPPHT